MGRVFLFILSYSVVLLGLFVTFLVLLINVNPPPIHNDDNMTLGLADALYVDIADFPKDLKFDLGPDKLLDRHAYRRYFDNLDYEEITTPNNPIPIWPSNDTEVDSTNKSPNISRSQKRSINNNVQSALIKIINGKSNLVIDLTSKDKKLNGYEQETKFEDISNIKEVEIKMDDKTIVFNVHDNFTRTIKNIVTSEKPFFSYNTTLGTTTNITDVTD